MPDATNEAIVIPNGFTEIINVEDNTISSITVFDGGDGIITVDREPTDEPLLITVYGTASIVVDKGNVKIVGYSDSDITLDVKENGEVELSITPECVCEVSCTGLLTTTTITEEDDSISLEDVEKCIALRYPTSAWHDLTDEIKTSKLLLAIDKLELFYEMDGECDFVKALCYMLNDECVKDCKCENIKSYDDGITKVVYQDSTYEDDEFENLPSYVKNILSGCEKCGTYGTMFSY